MYISPSEPLRVELRYDSLVQDTHLVVVELWHIQIKTPIKVVSVGFVSEARVQWGYKLSFFLSVGFRSRQDVQSHNFCR